jgi:transcriptional regulator with XRE-family HTH domain
VFADRLRTLRLERGLTQAGLAARSDVSVDAVRRLEKARYSPTLDTISKLARGLGLSLSGMLAVVVGEAVNERTELDGFIAGCTVAQQRLALRVLRVLFEPAAQNGE